MKKCNKCGGVLGKNNQQLHPGGPLTWRNNRLPKHCQWLVLKDYKPKHIIWTSREKFMGLLADEDAIYFMRREEITCSLLEKVHKSNIRR